MTGDTGRRPPGRWRRASLAALAVAAALAAPPVRAQSSDELARLREEAAQLRQSLERLEARIRALEVQKSPADNATPPPASKTEAAPGPQNASIDVSSLVAMKQNWSRVEAGTPADEVRTLLGEPQKVLRIDGNLVWYYAYPGIGRGSVFFNRDGKVSSTQSPSLGW